MIRLYTILFSLVLALTYPATDTRANELTDVLRQGLKHQKDGHKRAALRAFRRAIELAPADMEIRYNYGVVALQAKERIEAMTAFQRVVTAKPKHGLAQFNLGKLLNEQGQSQAALTHLEAASKLLSEDADAQVELAWAQAAVGRTQDAVDTLAAFSSPTDSMHSLRAFLALRQGRWEEAVSEATKAIRANSERLEHRILLATSMLYTAHRPAAMRALAKLYETEAGRRVSNILYALGLGAFLDGDIKLAKHRWSGLQGRNTASYDPESAAFAPMAFPTSSDRAYLMWAKGWSGPSAAPSARITEVRVDGPCQPGPIMAALLKQSIPLQRCLGTITTPVPFSAQLDKGHMTKSTAKARKRTADCLVDVLNSIQIPDNPPTCSIEGSLLAPR